ncbi:MAG: tetratricopeptide repeat protein [Candidatus Eiseniibacteriota bacterium]
MITSRRTLLAGFALLVALALTFFSPPARAVVLRSEIPGAHFKANDAAQVELNRVKSRLRQNNLSGAYQAGLAAIQKDSLSAEVFDVLGGIYMRQRRFRAAFQAYEHAAVLAPDQAPIWNRLAQVSFLQLGLEEEGKKSLEYALAADSLFGTAWYTKCVYHWTRAELGEADKAIERARAVEQDQSRSYLWWSTSLGLMLSRGDYNGAYEGLKLHLYQVPNDLSARQHMAQALRGLGRDREAAEALHYLLAQDPDQPVWAVEMGLVQRALGNRDSALVFFQRASRRDSLSFDAGYNITLERLAAGDTARAWTMLRTLRRVDPTNYLVPLLASRIHREEGDTAQARLAFDEARRLNPAAGLASATRAGGSPLPAWSSPELEAAEQLIERGEFSLAGDKLYQAAGDPLRRPAALYWLSRTIRVNRGAPGLPVLAARAGSEASGGDPILVRTYAEALWAAGDTLRTISALENVRKTSPHDLIGASLLAESLLSIGEAPAARQIFTEIAQEPTRSWRVESVRAEVLSAAKDAGSSIARSRAAASDYLPAPL